MFQNRGARTLIVALLIGISTALLSACTIRPLHHPATATHASVSPKASASPSPSPAPLATTVRWERHCPAGYGFCADFPGTGLTHMIDESSTSRTGMLDSFESEVYSTRDGHFCNTAEDIRCHDDVSPETYFVQRLLSKYTDPWTAITAINGGLVNPVRTTTQGNLLEARFERGIYGNPGITVFYKGFVYYAEAHNDPGTKVKFIDRFLASIHFGGPDRRPNFN